MTPLRVFVLFFSLALLSSLSSAQSHTLPPPVGGITFSDVIRLSQAGLSDSTIIAQIKMRQQAFALSADDLLQLKHAAVSDRVIEAMLGPAPLVLKSAPGSPAATPPTVQHSLPAEPGMYIATAGGTKKVIGQVITFNRSGSLLVSALTLNIKARHGNVQFPGAHALTSVDGQPVFYFMPVKSEADAGVDAGDLVLIKFEEKPQRRQFEVAAAGAWRASNGISITHQLELVRTEAAPGIYEVTPVRPLPQGEYGLYLRRNEGLTAYVYDFSSSGQQVH